MLGGFLRGVIKGVVKEYGHSIMKSVTKAYQQTVKEQSRRHSNPFNEFYKNMENKVHETNVMTRDEA